MICIILHHLIYHVSQYLNPEEIFKYSKYKVITSLFVESCTIMSVNTFVFISGYFSIKIKLKGLFSFWLQACIYSVFIGTIFYFTTDQKFSFLYSLFPFSNNTWWFFTTFLLLYLVSPAINKGMELMTNKQVLFFCLSFGYINFGLGYIFELSFLSHGYSFFSFINLYIIGKYLRKIDFNMPGKYSLVGAIFCMLCIFLLSILFYFFKNEKLLDKVFWYNNPLVALTSIFIFYSFKSIKINNNAINYYSPFIFGVYLIHDHYLIRNELVKLLNPIFQHSSIVEFPILLIVIALLIFLISTLIEIMRYKIFNPIIDLICSSHIIAKLDKILLP